MKGKSKSTTIESYIIVRSTVAPSRTYMYGQHYRSHHTNSYRSKNTKDKCQLFACLHPPQHTYTVLLLLLLLFFLLLVSFLFLFLLTNKNISMCLYENVIDMIFVSLTWRLFSSWIIESANTHLLFDYYHLVNFISSHHTLTNYIACI